MFSKTKSLILAFFAGAILMGAAGCTTAAEPAEPSENTQNISASPTSVKPTPTVNPKPIPASSNGPAQNWPVPEIPDAAKEKSEAGIAAFTKYWFELVSYSDATNDTRSIKSITRTSCFLCAEQIIDPADQNRAIGAWRSGGDIRSSVTLAKLVGADGVAGFSLHRGKMTAYTASGKVQGIFPETKKPMVGTLYLTFEDGWRVVDLEFIAPDTEAK